MGTDGTDGGDGASWQLRRLVAVLLLTGSWLLLAAAPAAACSCARRSAAETTAAADAVFSGVGGARHDPRAWLGSRSSADPIAWTLRADSVQKGTPDARPTMVSARSDGSCGFIFQVEGRYLVYAQDQGSQWATNLCSGTRLLAAPPATAAPSGPPAHAPPVGGDRLLGVVLPPLALGLLLALGLIAARRR